MTSPSGKRPYNFSAGPATLPEVVLSQAASEMLNWQGSGMSVMEMTHRGAVYQGLFEKVMADFRRLLKLPDHYKILFMQGGATAQNALLPMNILGENRKADYINTGHWSIKSITEARQYADVHVAATAEAALGAQHAYTYLPDAKSWRVRSDSS